MIKKLALRLAYRLVFGPGPVPTHPPGVTVDELMRQYNEGALVRGEGGFVKRPPLPADPVDRDYPHLDRTYREMIRAGMFNDEQLGSLRAERNRP